MDNGRDLDKSPTGPWNEGLVGKPGLKITSLPVVQHHPKMTWRKLGEVGAMFRPSLNPTVEPPGIPQSILTLPPDYQSLLSAVDLAKRAQSDPLYALIPLFAHSAFSEVAFLNLVHELLDKLTEPQPLGTFNNETFESLLHLEIILERHADQIRQSIRSIQVLSERSEYSSSQSKSISFGHNSFSAIGTLQDHEHLRDRCHQLLSRIQSAKNSEMNRAMILESRRAMEQSERMKKLTILATYFIPLTFTASLFGMNFDVLGQSELPVWWYLVLAVPFTFLTHVIYSSDLQALLRETRVKILELGRRKGE